MNEEEKKTEAIGEEQGSAPEKPENTAGNEEAAETSEAEKAANEEKTGEAEEKADEALPKAADKPAEKNKKPKKSSKNPFKSRKFKHGSLSVVFTVIFIAAVVLVNVIVNALLDRFSISGDMTEGAVFTLSDESQEYIKSLNDDIKLYVTADKDALKSSGQILYQQTVEFLDKMEAYNSRISVKYVNLLTDPDFSNNYDEDLKNYQIIVQSGRTGRYRILNIAEFLRVTLNDGNTYSYSEEIQMYVSYGMYSVTGYASNAEEQLISAMMSVSREDPTVVTFLTGYGESDSSPLEKILTDNAYVVEQKEIDRIEKIPDETDILVINGPTKDYSNEAITKIDEWLSNGGLYGKNLVYVATVNASELPNLNEYLAEWGLAAEEGLILQADSKYAYSTGLGLPLMQDLDLKTDTKYYENMKKVSNANLRAYPVRPITKLWDAKGNYTNTVIASAYGDKCILYRFDASEDWQPTENDYASFDVIVEASKVQYEGTTPHYSKIIAVGSDTLFSEYFTTASNFSNAEVALTLFDTNSENAGKTISITEKSFTAETYQLDSDVQTWIGITFAIIIPIVIIAIGIFVWAKRRRL